MTKDETEEVSIKRDQDAEKSLNIAKRSLVVKVLIEKALNKEAVKTILTKGLGDPEGMTISDLDHSVSIYFFKR